MFGSATRMSPGLEAVQEMRDLHLLRALKEGGHKWNPSVKRDRRSTALEGNILVASRTTREDQDDSTVLQNVTAV